MLSTAIRCKLPVPLGGIIAEQQDDPNPLSPYGKSPAHTDSKSKERPTADDGRNRTAQRITVSLRWLRSGARKLTVRL